MIGIIDYGSGNIQAIATIYKNLNIEHQVLNARDFGLPQNRERVFIVGFWKHTSKPFRCIADRRSSVYNDRNFITI